MIRRKLFSEDIIQISPDTTLHPCTAPEIFKSLGRVIPPISGKGEGKYYLVRSGEEVVGGLEVKEIPGKSLVVSHIGGGDTKKISKYFEEKGYPEFSFRTQDSQSSEAKMIHDPVFGDLWEITRGFSLHSDAPNEIKLKNNLILKKVEYGWFARLLGHIPAIGKSQKRNVFYDITLNGEEVGEICFNEEKKAPDTVYIGWIGVDEDYRGKHYATEVLKVILDFLKRQGYKKVTLEAVGSSSPDAHHIYQKLGFKDIKVLQEYGTGAWGGLTEMTKEFSIISKPVRTIQRNKLARQIRKARNNKVTPKTNFLGYVEDFRGSTGRIGSTGPQLVKGGSVESKLGLFERNPYQKAINSSKQEAKNNLRKKINEIASEEIKKVPRIR